MPDMIHEESFEAYPLGDSTTIEKRPDGTYVLDGIFHVAATPAFAALRAQVEEIVSANPERLALLSGPTLSELKQRKLAGLGEAFARACHDATVTTPQGWVADANDTAYRNIQGLLITMENTSLDEVLFCDADNAFHAMNRQELEALQQLVISHGQSLYQRKWEIRSAINEAQDMDALAAITISFA